MRTHIYSNETEYNLINSVSSLGAVNLYVRYEYKIGDFNKLI
jgi:hypothetical protein